MKSTMVTTTVAGVASLGVSAYGYSVEGGHIKPRERNREIATSIVLTASSIAANLTHDHINARTHEKYAASYVDSLSDEELALALEQIGELSGEDEVSFENAKTK